MTKNVKFKGFSDDSFVFFSLHPFWFHENLHIYFTVAHTLFQRAILLTLSGSAVIKQ